MPINPDDVRSHFPALTSGKVYFDGPGGTQVPTRVLDRMQEYMVNTNANSDAVFSTSKSSDALLDKARSATADFIHAPRPEEVVFGPNMTNLTFNLSRSLALDLQPDDEIIVTWLDHDANISPWLLAARDRECKVHWLDFDVEDCTLKMDQLASLLNERTYLVAVGYASNAVGTINPIAQIAQMAHSVGALCYVDAVHYAPHGPIDVQELDCDFLVMSAYKYFGPHVGVLYGKHEHLKRLNAYKVRPAPEGPPGKFESGTGNFEGIAGVLGVMEYLTELGRSASPTSGVSNHDDHVNRRDLLTVAMNEIRSYETELTRALIEALSPLSDLRIWGLTDLDRLVERVPTVSFTVEGHHPKEIAEMLDEYGIQVWNGNYYAPAVTERLGLESSGGMVRVGLVHYNTLEEIHRLENALQQILT